MSLPNVPCNTTREFFPNPFRKGLENGKVDIVLRECLHLKANSWHDFCDTCLFWFEVVDECGFARVVETNDDESCRTATEAKRSRNGLRRRVSESNERGRKRLRLDSRQA